ncbi:FadR/GntR family transcriptional regulator [Arthrobacter sp. FW306-2-2C-D06B]|uniref:FadR/GntR family transcriptional regulator n=1 Tax=Arthrobacter sp. FW306-2-2C-D06B TaxID=2879618 RepID=UPI001F3810A8|nr:FCD domain-containing protein [Arthrobacter sp. FW306-2-2C-D06B]UKA60462.1 FCD domain-containing protein [Arthrobacter sp. FW306-2-2C-D06B]
MADTTMPFSAMPIQRPRQQVQNQIKHAILEGSLRDGDRLPAETSLAQSFNVSRATIREALRSLIESGLLVKGPGTTSGLYVQSVDHNSLSRAVSERLSSVLDIGSVTPAEVSNFRDLLEVPSARLAAEHRTDENLAKLHEIIDQERSTTFDDPAIPELNAQFHSEIANASSNRVLAAFVSALHRTAHPLAFVHTDEQLGKESVAHHIQLYRAIKAQDPAGAADAMQGHLNYLREHAIANGRNELAHGVGQQPGTEPALSSDH